LKTDFEIQYFQYCVETFPVAWQMPPRYCNTFLYIIVGSHDLLI